MTQESLSELLNKALALRETLFDARHESALRLFNGFYEGNPNLVVDLYAKTILFHHYADTPEETLSLIQEAQEFYQSRLPWLKAGLVKTRNAKTVDEKRGRLLFGTDLDRKIKEHNVWYAIDLTLNQDASFYLDTRNLRKWIIENVKDKTVLNAFAYTGSLGVAALAGRASRVVQLDRNRGFLNVAKTSCSLNGFPINKQDFVTSDFFAQVAKFKRSNERFDCVFIDPPFFSTSPKGTVNQIDESARLINKVRPLIRHGGTLIAINNALYVSGKEYMQRLETLCEDGYLKIRELIPVPDEFTGYVETRVGKPITDPTPFNHSTKIAVLEVQHILPSTR
ncbi:MAG TPA: class I SAM-dependent methyltransferase [Anaerolineales bacterium]|nr:class I SAM-dependent methyltransferase [Anaerolineales bacterium]